MALQQGRSNSIRMGGPVSHEALVRVDERVAQILKRQETEVLERRESDQRDARSALRRQSDAVQSQVERRTRERETRARAHRSITRTTEGALGAPRSGSV